MTRSVARPPSQVSSGIFFSRSPAAVAIVSVCTIWQIAWTSLDAVLSHAVSGTRVEMTATTLIEPFSRPARADIGGRRLTGSINLSAAGQDTRDPPPTASLPPIGRPAGLTVVLAE